MKKIVDIFPPVQCWSNVGMSTPTFPTTTNVGPTYPCFLRLHRNSSLATWLDSSTNGVHSFIGFKPACFFSVKFAASAVRIVKCWSNVGMSTPTFPTTTNVGPTYPCYLGLHRNMVEFVHRLCSQLYRI